MAHKIIATTAAPGAIGPYSQAVSAGETTYFSGQIALDPATGLLVGDGDVGAETTQVMKNLIAVIEAADHQMSDVVKVTIFLRDMADFAAVNAIYGAAMGDHRPARATVAVAGLPKNVRVEIDAIAVRS